MPLHDFHPAVCAWFERAFPRPTPAQEAAWPAIRSGSHVLIAAPTGSGKTLAAFLAALDDLVQRGVAGDLLDETSVVYVSPLKALSNDVRLNLEVPIAGIRAELARLGLPEVELRSMVRTGDTPQAERAAMAKRPPHIVVTTPESLYLLLGSESGRRMLATTRTVIVDEIHAIAPSKRGSHLALSLERLDALCGRALVRVGLSATQKPIEDVARFLVGTRALRADGMPRCTIVDAGHARERDLALELTAVPLSAVMSGDAWQLVHARLAELIARHRTTLVFVNTRRMAERIARHLSERLGREAVTAHHGSMAKELRYDAEQRLKAGTLRVLVATASLELGIDVGEVDLVCQMGSPRSIAAFLQRVGRAGHAVDGTPKGRLFPLSRDDLVECVALLDAVRRGELDALRIPEAPLDVLAQQLVAEVACGDAAEDALFALARGAHPYRALARADFDAVVATLVQGYSTRRGARSAHLHRDAVHRVLHGRRGARLTALTSGGTIPETADYEVVLEPQAQAVGSVHEDFAIESMAGDVFQLGNTSYRVLRVERGRLRVEDAKGQPPTIPFWIAEAPGRTDELSHAVSRLRAEVAARLARGSEATRAWLVGELALDVDAARQLVEYLAAAHAALGTLPTQSELVLERFFDESGGTQLVIHAPFGSRLNRAFGLALRKRFCRQFNFELQAAALEDSIVLSLSQSHSFPLAEVARYLHSNSVGHVLTQALLDAPLFGLRWRWAASTALALPRHSGGKRVPPQIQRMRSEDLLAAVFPDQVACAENLVGEREVPDHPLVRQTLHDCLYEAMDLEGLTRLLKAMESGAVRVTALDLPAPSPLAAEILGARPYAFLDDAPLEERRTQAVLNRRWSGPDKAEDLGRLDPEAIAAVRAEAWPDVRDHEELHEALVVLGFLTDAEVRAHDAWPGFVERLVATGRATRLQAFVGARVSARPGTDAPDAEGGDRALTRAPTEEASSASFWVAAERSQELQALHPDAACTPAIAPPDDYRSRIWTRDEALVEILRARLAGLGPVTVSTLADAFALEPARIDAALVALEREGYVMRGQFEPGVADLQWCERHLLARIHRYTVNRLRREIEPVEARDFMRFLFQWQHVAPASRLAGPDALAPVLAQLEGFEAAASSWESGILPARVSGYEIGWLDELCRAGRVLWTRLRRRTGRAAGARRAGPVGSTPIVLLQRRHLGMWTALTASDADEAELPDSRTASVAEYLDRHGASFHDELLAGTRLMPAELEQALGELVSLGRAHADSFAGLRALLMPAERRRRIEARRTRGRALFGIADAGRWAPIRRADAVATRDPSEHAADLEQVARTLLRRYGVVGWRLLEREADWLPPWRELVRVYQRLEARGEIRGGRFVQGLSGEQFALPDAVGLLRQVRQQPRDGALVAICAADPLNLVGSVIAGAKVPALGPSRVLFRDGVPVATRIGGVVRFLEELPAPEAWRARQVLIGRGVDAPGHPARAPSMSS